MAYYIKVSKSVADTLSVSNNRNMTQDGKYLLWQADLDDRPEDTIMERAAAVDGVCLTANEARDEIDGAGEPHLLPSEKEKINKPVNIPELQEGKEAVYERE